MKRFFFIYIIPFMCILLLIATGIIAKNYVKSTRKYNVCKEKLKAAANSNHYSIFNSQNLDSTKPILRIRMMNRKDNVLGTIDSILKERYNVIYVNDSNYDLVIDSPHGNEIITNQKAVKFYYTEEAIRPAVDSYDLSIGFDHIDDPRYIRIPYAYMGHFVHSFQPTQLKVNDTREGKCNAKKANFACFLVGNGVRGEGATLRAQLFHKMSLYKKVLSGGPFLNNIGKPVAFDKTKQWFSQCKFVIAYENQSYDGYITEKPYQAYLSGAIPIYYAHINVFEDINKKAVIYAGDFANDDELVEYIKKIDQDDDLYCSIWNQKLIINPEKGYEAVYSKLRNKIFEVLDAKLPKK